MEERGEVSVELEVRLEPRALDTDIITYKARAPRARILQLLMNAVQETRVEEKNEVRHWLSIEDEGRTL